MNRLSFVVAIVQLFVTGPRLVGGVGGDPVCVKKGGWQISPVGWVGRGAGGCVGVASAVAVTVAAGCDVFPFATAVSLSTRWGKRRDHLRGGGYGRSGVVLDRSEERWGHG